MVLILVTILVLVCRSFIGVNEIAKIFNKRFDGSNGAFPDGGGLEYLLIQLLGILGILVDFSLHTVQGRGLSSNSLRQCCIVGIDSSLCLIDVLGCFNGIGLLLNLFVGQILYRIKLVVALDETQIIGNGSINSILTSAYFYQEACSILHQSIGLSSNLVVCFIDFSQSILHLVVGSNGEGQLLLERRNLLFDELTLLGFCGLILISLIDSCIYISLILTIYDIIQGRQSLVSQVGIARKIILFNYLSSSFTVV